MIEIVFERYFEHITGFELLKIAAFYLLEVETAPKMNRFSTSELLASHNVQITDLC
jgi:hypothetical protein